MGVMNASKMIYKNKTFRSFCPCCHLGNLALNCKDLFGADFRYHNVMVYLSKYINIRM